MNIFFLFNPTVQNVFFSRGNKGDTAIYLQGAVRGRRCRGPVAPAACGGLLLLVALAPLCQFPGRGRGHAEGTVAGELRRGRLLPQSQSWGRNTETHRREALFCTPTPTLGTCFY